MPLVKRDWSQGIRVTNCRQVSSESETNCSQWTGGTTGVGGVRDCRPTPAQAKTAMKVRPHFWSLPEKSPLTSGPPKVFGV